MAANYAANAGIFRHWKAVFWTSFWLGLIAACIFGVVTGCSAYQRGIYAGFHYDDARKVATTALTNQLVSQYGMEKVHNMSIHLGRPDVVNTHAVEPFGAIGRQLRVFHFIASDGVRYCVTVWTSAGSNPGSNVEKGCQF